MAGCIIYAETFAASGGLSNRLSRLEPSSLEAREFVGNAFFHHLVLLFFKSSNKAETVTNPSVLLLPSCPSFLHEY